MQQGLTQTEVAHLAGISIRTYSNWERDLVVPHPGGAVRGVASVFRVTPGFLLLGDEEGIDGNR